MNFRDKINDLQKATVVDRDGDKIGSVGQVYVHNGTETPSWVTVNTGLFGTNETFIPLDDAQVNGDEIRVPYEKAFVKDAPNINENGELTPEQENELYRYYGVKDPGYGGHANGVAGGVHGDRDHHDRDHLNRDHHDRDRLDGDREQRHGADLDNDEKVTLHEERVNVGTEKVDAGRLRLRKHVVTDTETVEVPVEREEVFVERTPASGRDGGRIGEEEVDVQLTKERPVINKETVATEDVHVGTRAVHDTERVTTDVSREEVDVDNVDGRGLNDRNHRRDGIDGVDGERGVDADRDRKDGIL